jgi:SAM-dependent methyltransferase
MMLAGLCTAAEVTVGPYVHFYERGQVTIFYKTDTAVASVVEYGMGTDLSESVEDAIPKTDHELIVPVRPETQYSYRIVAGADVTDTYEFYSAFDYGVDPFPAGANPYPVDSLTPLYEQAAEYIINSTGIDKGVCIDYGCGQGRLAYELSKRSNLKIIGFDTDSADVSAARDYLDEAGIYGVRVTVLNGDLSSLNCRDYSANLIVSDRMIADGVCAGTAAEMFRVLRPDGGVAILGQPTGCPNPLSEAVLDAWLIGYGDAVTDSNGTWAVISRSALAGAGEWTHYYANSANTANSGEMGIESSMKLLWYGQPGPRYITDRHNRPMSSLYKDGIVVTPGIHRLMAYDAYNGCRYWDMSIPESTRVAILRDSGWTALAEDYAYVAHKKNCVGLEIKTGEPTIHLEAPQLIGGQTRHWGYLAVVGDKIYGSGQKEGASLIGHSRANVYEAYYDNNPIATSDYLFCLDRITGQTLWTYQRAGGSVIINPGIVVAGDYVYFIESRNINAVDDSDGRVTASVLMSGGSEYLVKLNKDSGSQADTEALNLPFQHMTYLSYAPDDDLLIALGSYNDPGCRYQQHAYDAGTLALEWSSNYYLGGTGGDHGEQDQHPCIVGHTLYMRHYNVELNNNGSVNSFPLSRGNCGTQSACETHLLGRNGNPYSYVLPSGSATRLTNESRPGCWINMIPVGGLVLIPEASSGCTCDFSIQTSMSFIPY